MALGDANPSHFGGIPLIPLIPCANQNPVIQLSQLPRKFFNRVRHKRITCAAGAAGRRSLEMHQIRTESARNPHLLNPAVGQSFSQLLDDMHLLTKTSKTQLKMG